MGGTRALLISYPALHPEFASSCTPVSVVSWQQGEQACLQISFDQHARDVYVSHTYSIATCSEIPDILCLIKALTPLAHWT